MAIATVSFHSAGCLPDSDFYPAGFDSFQDAWDFIAAEVEMIDDDGDYLAAHTMLHTQNRNMPGSIPASESGLYAWHVEGDDLMAVSERIPLDVWLKFYEPATDDDGEDYLAEYEANTYRSGTGYVVEWYHNDVGLVRSVFFDTLELAHEWYATNGYEDYSS